MVTGFPVLISLTVLAFRYEMVTFFNPPRHSKTPFQPPQNRATLAHNIKLTLVEHAGRLKQIPHRIFIAVSTQDTLDFHWVL